MMIMIMIAGIIKGDEIMVINGAIVSDLDMMYIESVLQVFILMIIIITVIITIIIIILVIISSFVIYIRRR